MKDFFFSDTNCKWEFGGKRIKITTKETDLNPSQAISNLKGQTSIPLHRIPTLGLSENKLFCF